MAVLPFLFLLVGFALLWKGGDWIVDGADRFAIGAGMPPSLAGIFILGFATSSPELAVTLLAAIQGRPGLASGNVVGSNIANVGLILGAAAAIASTVVVSRFLRAVDIPFAILASVLALYLFQDGEFGTLDGVIALSAFAVYAALACLTVSRRPPAPAASGPRRPVAELALTALGLVALIAGADLFIRGASEIAARFGVPDVVIGLTLVAIGTSLPELATTVAAARSGRMALAVGNVIGSNIFNLLLVLGVAGVVTPQPDTTGRLVRIDLPVMLGLIVLAWIFSLLGGRLRRWQGLTLLGIYAGYLAFLVIQQATS